MFELNRTQKRMIIKNKFIGANQNDIKKIV